MSEAAAAPPRRYADEPARNPLIALSTFGSIALITGMFMYTYPETLRPIRAPMEWTHDISGDLMIVAAIVYLWIHLKRTFGLKKRAVSTWTGYFTVAFAAVLAGTGVYGQVLTLEPGSVLYWTHLICSVITTVLGCFHGVHGLRRRLR